MKEQLKLRDKRSFKIISLQLSKSLETMTIKVSKILKEILINSK